MMLDRYLTLSSESRARLADEESSYSEEDQRRPPYGLTWPAFGRPARAGTDGSRTPSAQCRSGHRHSGPAGRHRRPALNKWRKSEHSSRHVWTSRMDCSGGLGDQMRGVASFHESAVYGLNVVRDVLVDRVAVFGVEADALGVADHYVDHAGDVADAGRVAVEVDCCEVHTMSTSGGLSGVRCDGSGSGGA